jgi:hypothetical protein
MRIGFAVVAAGLGEVMATRADARVILNSAFLKLLLLLSLLVLSSDGLLVRKTGFT